jgi:hypothetical protein
MTALIRSEIDMTGDKAPWADEEWRGNAYKVTLRFQGRQLTVPFFTGDLHPWPTTRDVVECLASDFFCFDSEYVRDFEDFCSNLGYDPDSRKAEAQYRSGVHQTRKFKAFIGPDLLGWLKAEGDSELFAKRYSAEED